MTKILVAFYSRDGHTEQVALRLAAMLGADIERIREDNDRGGRLGYLRCAVESMVGYTPRIRSCRHRPQDYDLVIIGTPVWFWNMSSPVRSFAHRFHGRFKQVALFCTMGGSGDTKVLNDLERLVGQPALARMSVRESRVEQGSEARVFVRALKRRRSFP